MLDRFLSKDEELENFSDNEEKLLSNLELDKWVMIMGGSGKNLTSII